MVGELKFDWRKCCLHYDWLAHSAAYFPPFFVCGRHTMKKLLKMYECILQQLSIYACLHIRMSWSASYETLANCNNNSSNSKRIRFPLWTQYIKWAVKQRHRILAVRWSQLMHIRYDAVVTCVMLCSPLNIKDDVAQLHMGFPSNGVT